MDLILQLAKAYKPELGFELKDNILYWVKDGRGYSYGIGLKPQWKSVKAFIDSTFDPDLCPICSKNTTGTTVLCSSCKGHQCGLCFIESLVSYDCVSRCPHCYVEKNKLHPMQIFHMIKVLDENGVNVSNVLRDLAYKVRDPLITPFYMERGNKILDDFPAASKWPAPFNPK